MKIGIDLTVIQGPHRMRGIGSTLINFINNLPKDAKLDHSFVFYAYEDDSDPLSLLRLNGIEYEVRIIQPIKKITRKLPGKTRYIISAINQFFSLTSVFFGDKRITNLQDVDYFIQFDQNQPVPPRKKVQSALILYDLIQYAMEADYFINYATARKRGMPRLGSLRHAFRRWRYLTKTKLVIKKATRLVAISEYTKKDFVKYTGISPNKIDVCLLGVEEAKANPKESDLKEYVHSSWGPIPHKLSLANKQYLLYVGGADPRRKLVDLIASFNNLRARGADVQLVLVGDTMFGPTSIPNLEIQNYFNNTSYLQEIHFLGFVTDEQRSWLYKNAVAFVYPSVYEGFGLPIIEAMSLGCPVITYKNSSIPEVANDKALYASGPLGIYHHVQKLLDEPSMAEVLRKRGVQHALNFIWEESAKKILGKLN